MARLPSSSAFLKVLRGLLHEDVGVSDALAPLPPDAPGLVVAELRVPTGLRCALMVADLQFAASAGALLSMFPQEQAKEQISAGRLNEGFLDSYGEVANVLTAVYRELDTRVVLGAIWQGPSAIPPDAQTLAREPAQRMDLAVQLPGFGAGRLALLHASSAAWVA